jgi:hypothetical protein
MRDFTETKPFGTGCVGLGTLATSYIAGLDIEYLVTLSSLAMLAYHVFFFPQRRLVG